MDCQSSCTISMIDTAKTSPELVSASEVGGRRIPARCCTGRLANGKICRHSDRAPRTFSSSGLLVFALVTLLANLPSVTRAQTRAPDGASLYESHDQTSLIISHSISHSTDECLYEKMTSPGEAVTSSVFVTSGKELRVIAFFEGPVAPPEASTGIELQQHLDHYEKYGSKIKSLVRIQELLDFETEEDIIDDEYQDDFKGDDDDFEKLQDISEEERQEKRLERQKMREIKMKQKGKVVNLGGLGEPWQRTVSIVTSGWYRLCVRSKVYPIEAEMELRRSSHYGDIDPRTGHVPTSMKVAQREEIHELFLEEDPELPEGVIKDEDLQLTRDQLKVLNRIYNDIINKQIDERRTWQWRKSRSEHSHSHMVLGSLMETVVYIFVTGMQVYTIRKWFNGGPQLVK